MNFFESNDILLFFFLGEELDGVPGTQESYYEENSGSDEDSDENEEEQSGSESGSDNEDSFDEGSITINEDADNFKHMSESNLPNQMKKGNSVRSQLNIWENLLETRIQMQKCLLTANKFPQHETYQEMKKDPNFKTASSNTVKILSNMLNKFLLLQSLLVKQYGETKTLLKHDKKAAEKAENEESDEEIPSDTEDEKEDDSDLENSSNDEPVKKRRKLSDFESEIRERHQKYKNYRNNTIQKWNDKTRLASGKNSAVTNTVLQQIDYLLGDKNRLIKKSQLKKSDFEVLGKEPVTIPEGDSSKVDEYDTEIYDDTDFYHQLLRELIEVKSGDVTDPIQMSRQWIALQNLRSKMKRKVDTKATKGRKIRYVVHSKLVNFMAPITDNCWTNEAKNELYSSLFGKNQINK